MSATTLRTGGLRIPPVLASVLLLLAMGLFGSVMYTGFFSVQVFLNLLIDNAFLLVVAVGMTFVILTGGIDLSVGSVVALTTMVAAELVEHRHWPPGLVIPLVLAGGLLFGAFQGWLIQRFRLQPFLVTLAGMFPRARPLLRDQHRLDQHHRANVHGHRAGAHPVVRGARPSRWAR